MNYIQIGDQYVNLDLVHRVKVTTNNPDNGRKRVALYFSFAESKDNPYFVAFKDDEADQVLAILDRIKTN